MSVIHSWKRKREIQSANLVFSSISRQLCLSRVLTHSEKTEETLFFVIGNRVFGGVQEVLLCVDKKSLLLKTPTRTLFAPYASLSNN